MRRLNYGAMPWKDTMRLTAKVKLHTASPEPWLEVSVPRFLLDDASRAAAQGWATVTLEPPHRPRSTGPKSQNNRAWGFLRQIALATGNSVEAVEAACKIRALDEGYPIEKVLGQWVAKKQADLTVEEASRWIETIQRIAAEEGIHLKEE